MACTCIQEKTTCFYCLGKADGYVVGMLKKNGKTSGIFDKEAKEKLKGEFEKLKEEEKKAYGAGYELGQLKVLTLASNGVMRQERKQEFLVSHKEFGEMYHVVGAVIRSLTHKANIDRASFDQIVFITGIFGSGRLNFDSQNRQTYFKLIKEGHEEERKNEVSPLKSTTAYIQDNFKEKGYSEASSEFFNIFTGKLRTAIPHIKNNIGFYLDQKIGLTTNRCKAIIAIRRVKGSDANMVPSTLKAIVELLTNNTNVEEVLLFGDFDEKANKTELDYLVKIAREKRKSVIAKLCGSYYKSEDFKKLVGLHTVAGQLMVFKVLHEKFNVKFVIGMMSGSLDGPAFSGNPLVFLTDQSSEDRMPKASQVIPYLNAVTYQKHEIGNDKKIETKKDDAFQKYEIGNAKMADSLRDKLLVQIGGIPGIALEQGDCLRLKLDAAPLTMGIKLDAENVSGLHWKSISKMIIKFGSFPPPTNLTEATSVPAKSADEAKNKNPLAIIKNYLYKLN